MNNGELLKKTLFMASAMIVALNVSAATDTAKPVDSPYVAGEACDKANDLSTDRNAVVLSCKDRKWVPDGAVWGSQWSHDPMFLLQQAVGDATRSGRQCETTMVRIERGDNRVAVSVAGKASDGEAAVKRTLGVDALPVYRQARTLVANTNAHAVLVDQPLLKELTQGTDYTVVTPGVCAERVSVSSR